MAVFPNNGAFMVLHYLAASFMWACWASQMYRFIVVISRRSRGLAFVHILILVGYTVSGQNFFRLVVVSHWSSFCYVSEWTSLFCANAWVVVLGLSVVTLGPPSK